MVTLCVCGGVLCGGTPQLRKDMRDRRALCMQIYVFVCVYACVRTLCVHVCVSFCMCVCVC
jgi:hypothetical protein